MSFDSNAPIEDTVSSVIEFGIGAIIKLVMIIITIGVVVMVALGDAEASAESLLIGGVMLAGLLLGNVIIPLIFR